MYFWALSKKSTCSHLCRLSLFLVTSCTKKITKVRILFCNKSLVIGSIDHMIRPLYKITVKNKTLSYLHKVQLFNKSYITTESIKQSIVSKPITIIIFISMPKKTQND